MSMRNKITEAHSFKLNALTRKMRRFSLNAMRKHEIDLTIDQWGILGLLDEHDKPMSQTELASMMIKDSPTVSRILDILCKQGLVSREADTKDRRKFNLEITSTGTKAVKNTIPVVANIRSDLFSGFSKQDFNTLEKLICKIESNMKMMD